MGGGENRCGSELLGAIICIPQMEQLVFTLLAHAALSGEWMLYSELLGATSNK